MRGSDCDCVHLLYWKYFKINPNHGGFNVDSPVWIKRKKATVNPINRKDNKYFEYTVTVALNHDEIKNTRNE